jgi:hypothetical protein
MSRKAIYKYSKDFGRMGDLNGIFVADPDEVSLCMEQEVYWGEVLGKHSNVYHNLSHEDIIFITDNQEFVSLFEEYKLSFGYNPVERVLETMD